MHAPFSLLVKPASADCNLHCDYCFYLDKKKLYPECRQHRMQDEVLEKLIQGYLATSQPVYSMIWQGGEPTLMGQAFFERVTAWQKRYGAKGARIANSIQTNATHITDGMAAHFGKYHFLVGCSVDGPARMHDVYRKTLQNGPTHHHVLRGVEILRRHKVAVNALVLVSQANVHAPREVYSYLTNQGFTFLQFVPCVEFDAQGHPLPYSISGREWGEFMRAVFEEWMSRDRTRISVRLFESVLSKLVYGQATECCFGSRCDHYFVVEYNGDIYPCDFFVQPEYKIGNILDTTWSQAQASPVARYFAGLKQTWNPDCDLCSYQDLCMGDCPKFRMNLAHSPQELSWLCSGWKLFFDATIDRFTSLAHSIVENRPYSG